MGHARRGAVDRTSPSRVPVECGIAFREVETAPTRNRSRTKAFSTSAACCKAEGDGRALQDTADLLRGTAGHGVDRFFVSRRKMSNFRFAEDDVPTEK
eukprot:scaffold87864_cov39-Phaeocystis_antarctica.AAC.1